MQIVTFFLMQLQWMMLVMTQPPFIHGHCYYYCFTSYYFILLCSIKFVTCILLLVLDLI